MTNSHQSISADSIELRWARPGIADTLDEMRANAWRSGLADIGDTILIWVNEGDFWHAMLKGVQLKEYTSSDGEPSNGKQPPMASRPAPPVPSDQSPALAQGQQEPVVWASFTERGYVRFWTTDKTRAVAEMAAGTFNVKPYTVDDLMGMVVRASASQPPAAPVDTDRLEAARKAGDEAYKRWTGGRECLDGMQFIAKAILEADAHPRLSAATSEAGDPIRWIKDTYLMWLKGDLDPAHMRLGQHFFRAQPQVAPTQPFYGARCAAYPNCSGGCGCGCTHEIGDVEARIAVLSDALKRISKNTCCDNCQEAARVARSALGAYVGLARQPEPLSRSSAGSEGEPFMMLSCREAKQCLHNIPGCICDGDPTNG